MRSLRWGREGVFGAAPPATGCCGQDPSGGMEATLEPGSAQPLGHRLWRTRQPPLRPADQRPRWSRTPQEEACRPGVAGLEPVASDRVCVGHRRRGGVGPRVRRRPEWRFPEGTGPRDTAQSRDTGLASLQWEAAPPGGTRDTGLAGLQAAVAGGGGETQGQGGGLCLRGRGVRTKGGQGRGSE